MKCLFLFRNGFKGGLTIVLLSMLPSFGFCQTNLDEDGWVDSVFYTLNTEQKVGQLFMVRAFSKQDAVETATLSSYVESYHIGGVCFFQGNPVKQAELTNLLQAKSAVPLFIGIDGEWGLGMRFPESLLQFPKQIALGAIAEDHLIYEMGAEIAKQCRRLGIHFNFAPVIDINNNPKNPVINDRSFGEDKYYVTAKSIAYMKGLQDHGVLATAKHFPGHGDTHVDSHEDLPIIEHSLKRLHEVEFFPFKALIAEGVESIMVGHLHLPSYDDRPNRSATLSENIVTNLLRNELDFNKLIITDAMEMKGVSKHFLNGEAEAEAFLAGCDLILMPKDLPSAFHKIIDYLNQGTITPYRLEQSVRKILHAKYRAKAFNRQPIVTQNLISDLNNDHAIGVKTRLIEHSIILAKDDYASIPFTLPNEKKIMTLAIGSSVLTSFQKSLEEYTPMSHYFTKKEISLSEQDRLLSQAIKHNTVVISLIDMLRSSDKNYGITKSTIDLIYKINEKTQVVLVIFGNPYALKFFDSLPSIIVGYEDGELNQNTVAQALFGVTPFNGRLPITASPNFVLGGGISKNRRGVLGKSIPEAVGMSTKDLQKIKNITDEIIRKKAAPGGVVLVAKDNRIVYHEAFGTHTYASKIPVKNSDVYDLASITKIMSATMAVMKLYDQDRISLDAPLSDILPQSIGSNKAELTLKDIMAHHAGLISSINFYEATVTKKKKPIVLNSKIYSSVKSKDFGLLVAPGLYMRNTYADTIWNSIYTSPLRDHRDYKYSDLGFYLMKPIVEKQSNKTLEDYVTENFYRPLDMHKTRYNPLQKIALSEIAPTEIDDYFRKQIVQGTVHDMGAAMLGGVSGHAGVFSNAKDIATLMQMLLNEGSYGGKKYLESNTIDLFTTRYKGTRRGLGFDMKELDDSQTQNMCEAASDEAFGHTGFTGTCVFVDPKYNLIYVFLSNRTYPDMSNNLMNKNDYRIKIQELVYAALRN